jgi:hypothetical protein
MVTRRVDFLDLCMAAVSNGFTAGGLPTSLQITGRAHAEPLALRIGHAYQAAHDWQHAWGEFSVARRWRRGRTLPLARESIEANARRQQIVNRFTLLRYGTGDFCPRDTKEPVALRLCDILAHEIGSRGERQIV